VPAAQACIEQLLKGPTAANLSKWNAQDVGNAVYAVAQVGLKDLWQFACHVVHMMYSAPAANLSK
jgi:hypothetical protein